MSELGWNALDNMGSISNTETRKPSKVELAKRLRERGHLVVVGKIVDRDAGGMHARQADLSELKRATEKGER